ncbi:MAG: transposase [Anaerolineales bacterium]|nr:transposase [Anaerolineales bacterium]
MRTPKKLYSDERIIYHSELSTCPRCERPLVMHNYLAWDKTVQTLGGVLSIASRPGHCVQTTCSGHTMRLLSAQGQQIAMPGSTYGYDVLTRIGWLRQERRDTWAEVQADLALRIHISVSHVRYLYQSVYLPLLACHERQSWERLAQVAEANGGLLIALDGLAPEGGEPQLWFIRELLTGLTLRSGWLSRQDQATFEAFLQPVSALDWPILAVLSDKQRGLEPAVASVLPNSLHQFCQPHYLKNLAEPLHEADSAFKVALRKAVWQEIGVLIRSEQANETPKHGLLTTTGLLPTAIPKTTIPDSAEDTSSTPSAKKELLPAEVIERAETRVADDLIVQLLRRTRYLLTLKGRPPFCLAGIETYQRLQEVASLSSELLAHRHHPSLTCLAEGLQTSLSHFTDQYQELQQGATWLCDIAAILNPPPERPATGKQVAQRLRTYLDQRLQQSDISPRLDAFSKHLNKVSTSYWPGLFHCYDLEGHFRDTQRRLLRTTGQKGQTRRTLHRTGAWELLPRPPTEAERLVAFRQVPLTALADEQQRLRQHRKRFRLHTRSARRAKAQLDQLRLQWLALSSTPTG